MESIGNKVDEILESHSFEIHIAPELQDRTVQIELTDLLKRGMAERIIEVLPKACLELDMGNPLIKLVVFDARPSPMDYEGRPVTDYFAKFFFHTDGGLKHLTFNFSLLTENIRTVLEVDEELDADLKVPEKPLEKTSWTLREILRRIGLLS